MTTHRSIRRSTALAALSLTASLLSASGGVGATDTGGSTDPRAQSTGGTATEADRVAVGDLLFRDTRLSAAGNLACAVPPRWTA